MHKETHARAQTGRCTTHPAQTSCSQAWTHGHLRQAAPHPAQTIAILTHAHRPAPLTHTPQGTGHTPSSVDTHTHTHIHCPGPWPVPCTPETQVTEQARTRPRAGPGPSLVATKPHPGHGKKFTTRFPARMLPSSSGPGLEQTLIHEAWVQPQPTASPLPPRTRCQSRFRLPRRDRLPAKYRGPEPQTATEVLGTDVRLPAARDACEPHTSPGTSDYFCQRGGEHLQDVFPPVLPLQLGIVILGFLRGKRSFCCSIPCFTAERTAGG